MGGIWKKRTVRSIMFVSSYFPLYIFLLISHYENMIHKVNAVICNSFSLCSIKSNGIVISMLLFLIIGILISLCSLFLLKKTTACRFFVIEDVHRPDDKVMDYVFTYILPILGISIDNPLTILVNILLFLLIWFLYLKLNLLFLNPLWAIWGYVSYEYKGGHLITDIALEKVQRDNKLYGVFLANGIFLAHKKDNP